MPKGYAENLDPKPCVVCGEIFQPRTSVHNMCSDKCRKIHKAKSIKDSRTIRERCLASEDPDIILYRKLDEQLRNGVNARRFLRLGYRVLEVKGFIIWIAPNDYRFSRAIEIPQDLKEKYEGEENAYRG